MPETPYVETEALLAVMVGDREEAVRIVAEMLNSELTRLDGQLQFLRDIITGELYRRRLLTLAQLPLPGRDG